MGDNIQIELTNGDVLEIDEFDLDALALQTKHRMTSRPWSQNGYDLFVRVKIRSLITSRFA